VIKITPQTYGYQEEIFAFNTETGTIKSYPSLHEMMAATSGKKEAHMSFIKRSKQKLSFDDLIDLSDSDRGFEGLTYANKKIYSTNDIVSMQGEKPKSGLKRVGRSKFGNN
jgi:hypothetical protein